MYQRRTLALSDDERAELLYRRDHDPKPYIRERCAAVLQIADGRAPYAVAHAGLLRPAVGHAGMPMVSSTHRWGRATPVARHDLPDRAHPARS